MRTEPIQSRPSPPKDSKRIVCFRLDNDLDYRLSRALRNMSCSRSQFIRSAIERMLKQDGEDRLKDAHSAIRWE
jgi:predicted transcriptional regulator